MARAKSFFIAGSDQRRTCRTRRASGRNSKVTVAVVPAAIAKGRMAGENRFLKGADAVDSDSRAMRPDEPPWCPSANHHLLRLASNE